MNLKAVIFDFDFTLADSSKGFIDCHGYACEALSLPAITPMQATTMMGTPLLEAFRLLFADEHQGLAEEYVRLWQARADEVMTPLTEMYPNTEKVVSELRALGLKTGIVSQKLRYRIEEVLERDGIAGCFDVLVGGGDVSAFKPDPEGILTALERAGLAPAEAIYAGDTVIDAQAAANAGVGFVAVLTGVTAAEAFARYGALTVLPGISGLPELCRALS
ncbi:MAG TPA: HAD family hydrolase [Dehalococcoidia bacterium]